jgi:hypothetical protein
MKTIFSFLFVVFCAISPLFGQAPAIQWQKTIGGNGYDALTCIQQTEDGGYILGGNSDSNISGDKTKNCLGESDYWVMKLDASGNIQWQNTIGGNDVEFLSSLQQTTDGGYILGRWSKSSISGDKIENSLGSYDYWVVKLYSNGAIQWQNTIGGNDEDLHLSIHQTTDGGFILGGSSRSNVSGDKTKNSNGYIDYWVVKLNANGAIQWQNTIGGSGTDPLFTVQQTNDGGYILGGYSISDISGDKTENSFGLTDYWVVKLNEAGAIQWQNTIGGNRQDNLWSLKQTADGGYILGGSSDSNISGDKTENSKGECDYWVIKLAPESVPTEETPTAFKGIAIYSNPTTDAIFVQSELSTTLCLRSSIGQLLSTQTIQGLGKIDLSLYPNGIYFLIERETGIGHKILKNN